LSFTAIGTGAFHTCGLTNAAVVQCWGDNHWNELGDGSSELERATPGPVSGSVDIGTLTTGLGHSCQVSNSGAASCWGLNDEGQLGNGLTTDPPTPVAVSGGLTFSTLAGGGYHTCALSITGAAYCWGDNSAGQLGDGTTTSSPLPVRVVSGP
jgi:alpha-tubulin suppressor-like RCC1 family protein